MSGYKITKEEVDGLFPDGTPDVVMKLLFPEHSQALTVDEIREVVHSIAATKAQTDIRPLELFDQRDEEAIEWVTRNLMAIRRDDGALHYSLTQVIRAFQAGSDRGSGHVDTIRQLNAVVDAWEALPGGRQVRNADVAAWLASDMGPGIDAVRGLLRRPRPDGVIPPSPRSSREGLEILGKSKQWQRLVMTLEKFRDRDSQENVEMWADEIESAMLGFRNEARTVLEGKSDV